MKIFISSLITGMESIREAARTAIEELGHQPVMAEQFAASPNSPQVACLQGLRESGLVILILGARYGAKQASGLSATHEEYRAAKGGHPVIAFVEEDVDREPDEQAFVTEVQAWEGGLFRGGFRTPEQLRGQITRAIHEWELSKAAGPLNPDDMLARALALLPSAERRSSYYQSSRKFVVAVAGGPTQAILRPSQLEDPALAENLIKRAMFGDVRVFDMGEATTRRIENGILTVTQKDGASVSLDPTGAVVVSLPFPNVDGGWPMVIEEDVAENARKALAFAGAVLDEIDPTQRLTHVVIAATLEAGENLAWRTASEHRASPGSMSLGFQTPTRAPVHLTPPQKPRAALRHDAGAIVEDLVTLLRRVWKPR